MDEILHFCEKCGRRIPDSEWADGTATLAEGDRATCSACARLPFDTGIVPSRESQRLEVAPPATAARRSSRRFLAQFKRPRRSVLIAVLASAFAALLALAVTLYLLFARSDEASEFASGETLSRPEESPDQTSPVANVEPDAEPDGPPAEPPAELTEEERFRRRLAAEELAGLRTAWENQPDDREGFYYQLWRMMERYPGTPAAGEAAEWWTTLGVPDEFSAQINWQQAWQTATEAPRTQFHEEWGEKHFVLETHPPSTHEPIRMTRKLRVPEDKPFLVCPVRGHDEGDCEVWVEVDGKPSPHRTATAGQWQDLAVDLTDVRGQDVEVTIVNQATGWFNEYAYWQMPRFSEYAPAGSATAELLRSDVAQRPRETPETDDLEEPDVEERVANWERAIDLLAMVDPKRDTFTGQWQLANGALRCGRTSPSRLVFPYRPPEEYDMRIVFTVEENLEAVTLLLAHGSKNFCCTMGAWKNTICGFGHVNGKKPNDNPSTVRKEGIFQTGRRYTMTVQVRNAGLKAYLDGKLICQLATDYGNVSGDPDWSPDSGRRLWLGLGTWDTRVAFHSAQLAEVSGKGRMQLLPDGLLTSDLPGSERGVMARWLGDLQELLQRERYQEARERLQRLTATPPSPAARTALEQDAALLDLAERLLAKSLAGFTKLTDGRTFALWSADGTHLPVGADKPNRVASVKEGLIELEMRAGAGTVTQRLRPDGFALRSQVDAAWLAIPEGDAAPVERALGAVLRYSDGADQPPVSEVRGALDALAKQKSQASIAGRLRAWLEQAERERKAQTDFEAFKATAKVRSPEEFERAAAAFEKEHRETATYAKVLAEFLKIREDLERKPGLWAMYYSGDARNKFQRFHAARPEGRSVLEWKNGSPLSGVPADFFGIRFRGALRIQKDGVYQFEVGADDELQFWIDGRPVCSFVNNRTVKFALRLGSGEHDLKVYYAEHAGDASLRMRWKPPGAKGFSNIPTQALVHRPSAAESYRKD